MPPGLAQVRFDSRDVEASGHFSTDEARDEAGTAFTESASGAESESKFFEGKFFTLFRSRSKFLLQVTEDFVLQSRLSANEFLDRLPEGNFADPFLEFLGNDGKKDFSSRDGGIFDVCDWARRCDWVGADTTGAAAAGTGADAAGAASPAAAGASSSSSNW